MADPARKETKPRGDTLGFGHPFIRAVDVALIAHLMRAYDAGGGMSHTPDCPACGHNTQYHCSLGCLHNAEPGQKHKPFDKIYCGCKERPA